MKDQGKMRGLKVAPKPAAVSPPEKQGGFAFAHRPGEDRLTTMNDELPSVSRRSFLKGFGTTAAAVALSTGRMAAAVESAGTDPVVGPGAVPVTLDINGKKTTVPLEPRVTLLEALRSHLGYTGSKETCDRALCGACTVLWDGVPVYACMKLAIEAQGHAIVTVEGVAAGETLTPLQAAIVEHDASMCGYCTPGFVMSLTALFARHPKPTEAEIREACSGNSCRCGTQPRMLEAARAAAGTPKTSTTSVVRIDHGHLA